MDRLRKSTGLTTDGGELVSLVLGGDTPILAINARQTKSEKDKQKGFVNLLIGVTACSVIPLPTRRLSTGP